MNETFKSDCIENIEKQEQAIAEENQINQNKTEMTNQEKIQDSKVENTALLRNSLQNDWQKLKASAEKREQDEKETKAKTEAKEIAKTEREREKEFLERVLGREITDKDIFSAKDWCDQEIEPMQWFVDNIIPYPDSTDNKTINITGTSGIGKTTFVDYIIICMALSIPLFNDERFCTHNEEGYSIAIISLEDGCKRMKRLLQQQWKALVAKGIITKEQKPDIHYIFADELLKRTPDGLNFENLSGLFNTWDNPPILIVLDSQIELNGLFGTSLNDNTDVTQSLRPFRNLTKIFNCNTLIINHPQKNSSVYQDAQMRITGAGSQITASKSILHLQKATQKDTLELTFAKSTYMPEEFRSKKFIIRRNDDCTFDLLDMKEKLSETEESENNLQYINLLAYANDLHEKQRLSFSKIADRLSKEGKKTISGFDWKTDNIRREVNKYKQGFYTSFNQEENSKEEVE